MANPIEKVFGRFLEKERPEGLFCLYIDFPFCSSVCDYCIYKSNSYSENIDVVDRYQASVVKEVSNFGQLIARYQPDCIYFGGGSPSLWGAEALKNLCAAIPNYDCIPYKKMELHPADTSLKKLQEIIEIVRPTVISLGVQSFDAASCRIQNRTHSTPEHVKKLVDLLHQNNIWVNIDLVGLFGSDNPCEWTTFENDVLTALTVIQPDVITSVPNYKTKLDYFEQVAELRKILTKGLSLGYMPPNNSMLSLSKEAIRDYGRNDHWMGLPAYWEFMKQSKTYSCTSPRAALTESQATLAFGGFGEHEVYSYIPTGEFIAYSTFDCKRNEFIYKIKSSLNWKEEDGFPL